MLVSVLASGSKGNSTLIKTDKLNCLIDVGMNLKYMTEKLENCCLTPSQINYIFITHTHKDHTAGLKTFIKKNNPVVFIGSKMLDELDYLKEYDNLVLLKDEKKISLEDLNVDIIMTSHDAIDSRGYVLTNIDSSLVYITDTGYINNKYFKTLYNKSMYVMESNHDIEMLMHGRYPKWLKARVLSDKGHLSNKASAFYLSKLIGDNTKNVVLAHLSEENNTEELALDTLRSVLFEYGIKFNNISVAKQLNKTENFII